MIAPDRQRKISVRDQVWLSRRSILREVAGCGLVIVAGVVTLLPTLVHGGSIGSYQEVSLFGLLQRRGETVHGFLQSADQFFLFIPWKALSWNQVHNGHLPLWNPFSVLGMPLAFNWEAAPFSLQALLGYLAPVRFVYTISIVTTLVVGGTGVYFLCRVLRLSVISSVMAGVVYELSGPFMGLLAWQDTAVMCWAGWLFAEALLILRGRHRIRHIAGFALVLALAGYGGQPAAVFLLGLALAIFLLAIFVVKLLKRSPVKFFLRAVGDLVIAALAGLALWAPLALPALQVSALSVRNRYEPSDDVSVARSYLGGKYSAQALSLHDLTHVLFQRFDGFPVSGGAFFADRAIYFDSAAYLGVITVVLIGVAVVLRRRDTPVVAFAAVTAFMACLVFVSPVVSLADRLPLVGNFLWNRALIPMAFGASVLTGVGTDLLVRRHGDGRVRLGMGAGFGLAAVVLVALWLFGRGHLSPVEASVRSDSFVWPAISTAVGLAAVAALRVIHRRFRAGRSWPWLRDIGRWSALALLACETAFLLSAGIPLWSSNTQFLPVTPGEVALKRTVGSAVVGFGNSNCVFGNALGLRANLNVAYGVSELAVYDPSTPLAYFNSWKAASGTPGGYLSANIFCPAVTTATLARRYGVSFVLEPKGSPGPSGAVFDRAVGDEWLYRIPGAAEATLSPLGAGGALPGPDAPGTPVRITDPGPSSLKLKTDGMTQQVLRLRLTDVPGWRASIDGHPLELKRFSGVMLQAQIPPGRHLIELHYWPSYLTVGLVLACLSALGLGGAGLVSFVVRRRRPTVPQVGIGPYEDGSPQHVRP